MSYSLDTANLVAGYGALVATVVAMVQFSDWRKKRNFIDVKITVCSDGDAGLAIETRITNRGAFPVFIENAAACRYERPWYSPWLKRPTAFTPMQKLVDVIDSRTDGFIDGTLLAPGDTVYGLTEREVFINLMDFPSYTKIPRVTGDCVLIDHSQSNIAVIERVRWRN